ncbi:uncharacterized protein A4U43_C08F28130 [Asparagus officinalis]|nr:uncharacterized protein A4U43_C08F28130 [Asparagus officinalis]
MIFRNCLIRCSMCRVHVWIGDDDLPGSCLIHVRFKLASILVYAMTSSFKIQTCISFGIYAMTGSCNIPYLIPIDLLHLLLLSSSLQFVPGMLVNFVFIHHA